MKTYIFPYTLDDGSLALWSVQADSAEYAIAAFRGVIGDGPEGAIQFAVLPGGFVPGVQTLVREVR